MHKWSTSKFRLPLPFSLAIFRNHITRQFMLQEMRFDADFTAIPWKFRQMEKYNIHSRLSGLEFRLLLGQSVQQRAQEKACISSWLFLINMLIFSASCYRLIYAKSKFRCTYLSSVAIHYNFQQKSHSRPVVLHPHYKEIADNSFSNDLDVHTKWVIRWINSWPTFTSSIIRLFWIT